jgi:uncharacterized protein (TIGR01777 family)
MLSGKMKTIGITGGTGFIGHHLTALAGKDYRIIVFTRHPGKHAPEGNITYAYWEPAINKCDTDAFKDIDAVVHLAGAGIADKRWTDKRKAEIVSSRVNSTRFLIAMLKQYAPQCRTFISASAIGYYGADHDNLPFKEDMPPVGDFLGRTCVQWEEAATSANAFARTVILRFGIVLGKDGGAYPQLAGPLQFPVLPILGNGKQVVSWVHVDDLAAIIYAAIHKEKMQGVYNAVAPNPVTHEALMRTIARNKGGWKLPVHIPSFVLKAVLSEMSIEVLKSCTVSAARLLSTGFQYKYPTIKDAIAAITGGKHNR